MKNRLLFLVFGLLTAILLVGCAAIPLPPLQPPAPEAPLTPRDKISSFAVDGRFALKITQPDGQSENSGGRLSWTHDQQRDRVLLANPLGIGLAEIDSTPEKTRLRTADGKAYAGDDADLLIAEVTGQPLPISHLPAWLLGRPKGVGHIEHDQLGRPTRLQEAGWRIEYRYADEHPDSLPMHLGAFGEIPGPAQEQALGQQLELRLRIENWKILP